MNEKNFRDVIAGLGKDKDGKSYGSVQTMEFELELAKAYLMFDMVKELKSIVVEIESLRNTWEQKQV